MLIIDKRRYKQCIEKNHGVKDFIWIILKNTNVLIADKNLSLAEIYYKQLNVRQQFARIVEVT